MDKILKEKDKKLKKWFDTMGSITFMDIKFITDRLFKKALAQQKAKLVKEIEQGIDKYFNDGVEKTVFKQKILNKYK